MVPDAGDRLAALGRSWTVILVVGLVSLAAGIATVAWPGRTIVVVAVLIGVQLLVSGTLRLTRSLAAGAGEHRDWGVIVGLGSLVVGILCLRDVFQTIAALTLIVGIMWVVQGIAEFLAGVAGLSEQRGPTILLGILGFVAGVVVLTYPIDSVRTLAWVLGVWLTVSGAIQVAAAFAVRRLAAAASLR
jgi:uncharacterized membrane protein HdeD (DUF308 family)